MISEDNLKLYSYIGSDSNVPLSVANAVKEQVESTRVENNVYVIKHWNFYQGYQSQYFSQRPSEDNEVFKFRKSNAIITNYCKYIVDLGAKYIYGKPQGIRRTFSKNTKTESRMRVLEKLNQVPKYMLKSKKTAGIFSQSITRFVPVDERTNTQVIGNATETVYPRAIELDPRKTFPLKNSWGKLIAVVIVYETTDYVKGKKVTITELVVPDSRWIWEDEKLKSSEPNSWSIDEEFVVLDNSVEEKDDIQDILNIQIKLNEALTDAQHFFEKHGWPQLVTKVDLSQVTKSPGYIWQVNTESEGKVLDDIDFLTWDGKMKEARQHIQDLESYILKMSSTAKMSTGDLEAIGQLRSGAAIVAAHGPSIQKAEERQVIWRQNEINFFNSMAKMDARLHGLTVDKRMPELNIDIAYTDQFVPGEELIRAEIDSMLLNSHCTTIKDIVRRRYPNYTEEQVDSIREEIIADSNDLVDSKRAFVTEQKTEQNGQPVSSGQKKSKEQKTI